jgi:hypothetical protein
MPSPLIDHRVVLQDVHRAAVDGRFFSRRQQVAAGLPLAAMPVALLLLTIWDSWSNISADPPEATTYRTNRLPSCWPPFGRAPSVHWLRHLAWFSSCMVSSSRRETIPFWIFCVCGPPRASYSRRSTFSILRAMAPRSLPCYACGSGLLGLATSLYHSGVPAARGREIDRLASSLKNSA